MTPSVQRDVVPETEHSRSLGPVAPEHEQLGRDGGDELGARGPAGALVAHDDRVRVGAPGGDDRGHGAVARLAVAVVDRDRQVGLAWAGPWSWWSAARSWWWRRAAPVVVEVVVLPPGTVVVPGSVVAARGSVAARGRRRRGVGGAVVPVEPVVVEPPDGSVVECRPSTSPARRGGGAVDRGSRPTTLRGRGRGVGGGGGVGRGGGGLRRRGGHRPRSASGCRPRRWWWTTPGRGSTGRAPEEPAHAAIRGRDQARRDQETPPSPPLRAHDRHRSVQPSTTAVRGHHARDDPRPSAPTVLRSLGDAEPAGDGPRRPVRRRTATTPPRCRIAPVARIGGQARRGEHVRVERARGVERGRGWRGTPRAPRRCARGGDGPAWPCRCRARPRSIRPGGPPRRTRPS